MGLQPLLLLLFAIFCLSLKGVLAKFAYMAGVTVLGLLILRFSIALPFFWAGFLWKKHKQPDDIPQMSRPALIKSLIAGGFFFLAAYCDFAALSFIGVGISRIILFTFPIFVILLTAMLDHQMPKLKDILLMGVAYSGLLLALSPAFIDADTSSDLPIEGVLWSVASSISYAIYLIAGQEIMKSIGSRQYAAYSNTGALLSMLACAALILQPDDLIYTLPAIGWTALIAIVATVIPFFIFLESINRFGATKTASFSFIGPIFVLVLSWLIFDEEFTWLQSLGIFLILMGIGALQGLIRTRGLSVRKMFGQTGH